MNSHQKLDVYYIMSVVVDSMKHLLLQMFRTEIGLQRNIVTAEKYVKNNGSLSK